MPPSGYSAQQADFISEFLRSCARDLEREATGGSFGYVERLTKEIDDIGRYLETNRTCSPAQRAVLELTADFYGCVRGRGPCDASQFWGAVNQSLEDISHAVKAIHIDESANPRALKQILAAE